MVNKPVLENAASEFDSHWVLLPFLCQTTHCKWLHVIKETKLHQPYYLLASLASEFELTGFFMLPALCQSRHSLINGFILWRRRNGICHRAVITRKPISKVSSILTECSTITSTSQIILVWFVLWHVNYCWLFNAKSCLYIINVYDL